jgi:hypothetical protein
MDYLKKSADKMMAEELSECSQEKLREWQDLIVYPNDLPQMTARVFPKGEKVSIRFLEILYRAQEMQDSKNGLVEEMASCSQEQLFKWRSAIQYPSDLPPRLSRLFPRGETSGLRFFELLVKAEDLQEERIQKTPLVPKYGQIEMVEPTSALDQQMESVSKEQPPIYSEEILKNTWVSASECGPCEQIENPKDHTHFEEYPSIDKFVSSMNDVEQQWFEKKCTDPGQTGYDSWKKKNFFNLKAMVHYLKWGKFVEYYALSSEPKMISQKMEEYYRQGKLVKANSILTSTLLGHTPDLDYFVPYDFPVFHYRPYMGDSFIEVYPRREEEYYVGVRSFHVSMKWGRVFGRLNTHDSPYSLKATHLMFNQNWRAKNSHLKLKAEDEDVIFYYVSHLTNNPFQKIKESNLRIYNEIKLKKNRVSVRWKWENGFSLAMERRIHIAPDKIVFLTQTVPMITVAMERWLKRSRTTSPSYCLYPKRKKGNLRWDFGDHCKFVCYGESVDIETRKDIKVAVYPRCNCLGNYRGHLHPMLCSRHGGRARIGSAMVSVLCDPILGDDVSLLWNSAIYQMDERVTSYRPVPWSSRVGEDFPMFLWEIQPHFFSWPSIGPIGFPALGYRTEIEGISLKMDIKKNLEVVNGWIGASSYQEWNIPIDVVLLLKEKLEDDHLFVLILFWIVTIENRFPKDQVLGMWGGLAKDEET